MKRKRWTSILIVAPVLVGAAWLMAGRRRTIGEDVTPHRANTTSVPPAKFVTPTPSNAGEPSPLAAAPVATSAEEDDELVEGATQAEIEAAMAKAKAAYPRPTPAAIEERNRFVGELAASGPGGTEWLGHFKDVERDWLEIAQRERFGIKVDAWTCFKNGCAVTTRAPSVELLERFSSFVRDGRTTRDWRGAGFRSGPIETDKGEIEATWIFYAPPPG